MVPPVMLLHKPVNCIATRCVRTATNKLKCPIFCTCVSYICISAALINSDAFNLRFVMFVHTSNVPA